MRETRLSGSEGGAGSSPVPTPILIRDKQFRVFFEINVAE